MRKFLAIGLLFLSACAEKEQVDMVITGAKVYTCDSIFSTNEAIAIKDGNILAIDTKENILKQYKTGDIIDE